MKGGALLNAAIYLPTFGNLWLSVVNSQLCTSELQRQRQWPCKCAVSSWGKISIHVPFVEWTRDRAYGIGPSDVTCRVACPRRVCGLVTVLCNAEQEGVWSLRRCRFPMKSAGGRKRKLETERDGRRKPSRPSRLRSWVVRR